MDGKETLINPDHVQHADLIKEFEDYIKTQNCIIIPTGYESMYLNSTIKLLQRNFTPEILEIRTHPDGIVKHKFIDSIIFNVEFKTETGKYPNLSLELIPFINNKKYFKEKKIDCLYVVKVKNKDYGFWSSNTPYIARIIIPPRYYEKDLGFWVENLCKQYYPEIEIERNPSSGSNDPFLIIHEKNLNNLPDWRKLIELEIDQKRPKKIVTWIKRKEGGYEVPLFKKVPPCSST